MISEEFGEYQSDDSYYSERSEDFDNYIDHLQKLNKYLATFNLFVGEQSHKGLHTNNPSDMQEGTSRDKQNGEGISTFPTQPQRQSEIQADMDI